MVTGDSVIKRHLQKVQSLHKQGWAEKLHGQIFQQFKNDVSWNKEVSASGVHNIIIKVYRRVKVLHWKCYFNKRHVAIIRKMYLNYLSKSTQWSKISPVTVILLYMIYFIIMTHVKAGFNSCSWLNCIHFELFCIGLMIYFHCDVINSLLFINLYHQSSLIMLFLSDQ